MPSPLLREQLLDRLPQAVAGGASLPAWLEHQLAEDDALQTWWRRQLDVARVLARLPRVAVPDDLEGRVVAATQGGFRQERATAYLASLTREEAPSALDGAVRREVELPFGDVERAAPAALDTRVALDLAAHGVRRGRPTHTPHRAEPRGRRPGSALAAALAFAALVAVSAWLRRDVVHAGAGDPAPVSSADITLFKVVHVTPDEAPELRAELDALTGGALGGGLR